ncbi:MAG: serine aminopeptidase domain-containing protein [Terracidiphilus sp.]
MQNQLSLNGQPQERAGYFPVSGAHLYTVLHEVEKPVARVLLVGPFASERHNSYLPWVRWARFLAAENIEVLRYDYRGIGESTGSFELMTFEDWGEDVRLLSAWLANRAPHAPLLLHGLGMGAVLAGRAFDEGIGDGLLLWSAPANANQALRSTLMRWVGLEQIFKFGPDRKSASDYIRELEQGSPLEVDGYRWPVSLWRDSFAFTLPAALESEESAAQKYNRPVRIVKLTREAAPLTKGGLVGYDDLKDFSWLYAPNRAWIAAAAAQSDQGVTYA